MTNGVNIDNLTGAVQAFARAADQNSNGTIDKNEIKLFRELVTNAGLGNEDSFNAEMKKATSNDSSESVTKMAKEAKKAQKEEEKLYNAYFGKEKDSVKTYEGEANRRVQNAFKQLRTNNQMSPQVLNDAIASRPKMTDYLGKPEDYKMALTAWAASVEQACDKSVADMVNENTDKRFNQLNNIVISGFTVLADGLNKIDNDINNGFSAVQEQIKTEAGNIVQVVKTSSNKLIGVIRDAQNKVITAVEISNEKQTEELKAKADEIVKTIQDEHKETRDVIHDEADNINKTTKKEGQKTRDEMKKEADRVIDTLDPTYANRIKKAIRDKIMSAGGSIADYIKANPKATVATLLGSTIAGIPIPPEVLGLTIFSLSDSL